MTVAEYAKKILKDHGCDEYTYGGEYGKHVMEDLKEAYPNGMEFPYIDVANAILSISKQKPIVRAPWIVVWDNGECCDSVDAESFELAKCHALSILMTWMFEARDVWEDVFNPTDDELNTYNYCICESSVEVQKYNPSTDEYEEYWAPSDEDEAEIGWRELSREDVEFEETIFGDSVRG